MNNGSAEYLAYQYQFTNISKFEYYSRQVNSVKIHVFINLLCRELRVMRGIKRTILHFSTSTSLPLTGEQCHVDLFYWGLAQNITVLLRQLGNFEMLNGTLVLN